MEAPFAGYAPSHNRIKQWPRLEALIEGWLASFNNLKGFKVATDGLHPSGWLEDMSSNLHAFSSSPSASVKGRQKSGVETPDLRFSGVQDFFVLTSPSIEGVTAF
jgi:hypothetical protein